MLLQYSVRFGSDTPAGCSLVTPPVVHDTRDRKTVCVGDVSVPMELESHQELT
jgi:hypothetical protein